MYYNRVIIYCYKTYILDMAVNLEKNVSPTKKYNIKDAKSYF